MPAPFVHLRLHSAFSLTESTLRIDTLTKLVSDDSQPAAAITDTNNMFGAMEFAQSMAAAGVKPIMGAQIELEDGAGRGDGIGSGGMAIFAYYPSGNRDLIFRSGCLFGKVQ